MGLIESLYILRRRLGTRAHTLLLQEAFASFGSGSRIASPFRGANLSRVSIGDDVYISEGCWIEPVRGFAPGRRPIILIGHHVRLGMDVTITAASSVILEDDAAVARNVFISDHSHAFEDPVVPIYRQGLSRIAPVRICSGAWLGHGAVVLPGVTIGRNAVVGANAVVTTDVPDCSVAVGAPARVVRRFDRGTGQWERCDGVAWERGAAWRRSSGA